MVAALRLIIRLLPLSLAWRFTYFLASLTQRLPLTQRDREALKSATKIQWGPGSKYVAWSWGTGPVVLLVHGWGGRATQMATLAQHLAWLGYRAVAMDITGHGDSPGRRMSFTTYFDDISRFVAEVGQPLHAVVGHSAGGLAMMAARELRGLRAEHYVVLNAPRAPYPPINIVRRILRPSEAILDKCRLRIAEEFEQAYDVLIRGYAHRYLGHGRLMLVYDEDDNEVEHTDAEIIGSAWPQDKARTLKTQGLGHHRVVWNEKVLLAVGDFISQPVANEDEHGPEFRRAASM